MKMLISALATTASNAVLEDFTYTEPVDSMELPLAEELWLYFYENYLNPAEYYPNLDMGTGTMLSIRLILIGLFLGLIVACFCSAFTKQVLGNVVRTVLGRNALSPESAVMLEELGMENNVIFHYALTKSYVVRKVVRCREEEEHIAATAEAREKYEQRRAAGEKLPAFKEQGYEINPYADHFYIPEDLKYSAEIRFEEKGSGWLWAIICSVVLLIMLVVILVYLPQLLSLLDSFAALFK